jgi:hypothetical protein
MKISFVENLVKKTRAHALFLLGDPNVVLQQSDSQVDVRSRGHFYRNLVEQPLSIIIYLRVGSGQDHGEIVITIGNNTLHHAAGALHIKRLELFTHRRLRVGIREPAALRRRRSLEMF